jgi:hypothetical protein
LDFVVPTLHANHSEYSVVVTLVSDKEMTVCFDCVVALFRDEKELTLSKKQTLRHLLSVQTYSSQYQI